MAVHTQATFWFVLPSLPTLLLIAALLRQGVGFWWALAAGCLLTIMAHALMTALAPRLGLNR